VGQNTFPDPDTVGKPGVVLEVVEGSGDPPSGFADSENHCFDTRFEESTKTHQARFNRDVERRSGETIIFHMEAGRPKGDDFRMGCRIHRPYSLVVSSSEDGPVPVDKKGTYRDLVFFHRCFCFRQRFGHPPFVHIFVIGIFGYHESVSLQQEGYRLTYRFVVLAFCLVFLVCSLPVAGNGEPLTGPDDPAGLRAPLQKSARLILENHPEKAVPILKTLLKAYPDYAMVHFLLGLAYGKLDENEKAVIEERKALVLNPKSEAARVSLGIALGNTGHFRQEIRSERQALALNPKNEMAWEAIGWAYASRGNWRLARASEEKALKIRSSDPSAHMILGVALAHLGFPEEGMTEEKEASRLDPDDRGVKRAISWIATILHPVKEGTSGNQGHFNPLLSPENGPDIPGVPSPDVPANPNNNGNGTLRAPVGH